MSDGEGSTPHVEKIAGEIIAKDAAKDAKKGRPGKGVAVARDGGSCWWPAVSPSWPQLVSASC